jgi:hypothetical protein
MILATENQYIIVFIIKKGFANLNKKESLVKSESAVVF